MIRIFCNSPYKTVEQFFQGKKLPSTITFVNKDNEIKGNVVKVKNQIHVNIHPYRVIIDPEAEKNLIMSKTIFYVTLSKSFYFDIIEHIFSDKFKMYMIDKYQGKYTIKNDQFIIENLHISNGQDINEICDIIIVVKKENVLSIRILGKSENWSKVDCKLVFK